MQLQNEPPWTCEMERSLLQYSVALIPMYCGSSTSDGQGKLAHPGSGTLVTTDNGHFILTAAHVWEELAKSDGIGLNLSLQSDTYDNFVIETKHLNPTATVRDNDEFGPDLCMLRIPIARLALIQSRKIFYNLTVEKTEALATLADPPFSAWAIVGTPRDLGQINESETQGTFNHHVFQIGRPERLSRDDHDYLEFKVYDHPPAPRSFKGVSGGGVWRVLVENNLVSRPVLEGVAFYQSPVQNEIRIIRCHGRHSIDHAISRTVVRPDN